MVFYCDNLSYYGSVSYTLTLKGSGTVTKTGTSSSASSIEITLSSAEMTTLGTGAVYAQLKLANQFLASNIIKISQEELLLDGTIRTSFVLENERASNRNLLDNPWFTINQRGASGIQTSRVYCVDRWMTTSNSTVTINSGYITVQGIEGGGIAQRFEDDFAQLLLGKKLTASILLTNGTILTTSVTAPSTFDETWYGAYFSENIAFCYVFRSGENRSQFSFCCYNSESVNIKAVKLELGSVSTLHMDVAPNYAEELAKCQRYFYHLRFGSSNNTLAVGGAHSTKIATFNIFVPMTMRKDPTVTYSGTVTIMGASSSTDISTASSAIYRNSANQIATYYTFSSAVFTKCEGLHLRLSTGGYFDISAEL